MRKSVEKNERGAGPFPLELTGPIRREDMREALSRCNPDDDDIPSVVAVDETNESKHDEALKLHLPAGSVYIWAARLDGAHTSDAIVGWIVLLVSAFACRLWLRNA